MNITLSPELFVDWAKHELPNGKLSEVMKRANELAEINGCLDLPFNLSIVNWYALKERLNLTEEEQLLNYVINHFTNIWYKLHIDPILNQEWKDSDIDLINTYIKALKQVSEYKNTESSIDLLELNEVKPELLNLLDL